MTGSDAVTFDGLTGCAIAGTKTNPKTFSIEAWFKTTTTSGGKLVGYGNKANGLSTTTDRNLYKVVTSVAELVQAVETAPRPKTAAQPERL